MKLIREMWVKSIQLQIAEAERDYANAVAQQKAKVAEVERLAYEAVQKYRLNPDQALTTTQCDAGLAACQKYLDTYPGGEYAAAVQQQSVQLQQEKEQVEKGLLKSGNQWMTVSQRAAEQAEAARLQAEKESQALAEQQEQARLQAERDHQALVERERKAERQRIEAQHQRVKELWSELGRVILSAIMLSLLVGGFAVSLRVGARLAKIENVTSRTTLLASVTALVALAVIVVCLGLSLKLSGFTPITALVLGTVATSFTVKSIFRATWEQALLTNMFAAAVTTVGMTILMYLIAAIGLSCSILDLVKWLVPGIP